MNKYGDRTVEWNYLNAIRFSSLCKTAVINSCSTSCLDYCSGLALTLLTGVKH